MKENKKKALYSKELIEKLKKNVCLEEVVKNDFELKKVGEYYYMHCPFCNGGRILSISKKKQFGYCKSCQETFDVFSYFQKVKGLSFYQAIIEIKKIINKNNDIELKKLIKAADCLMAILDGNNPILNKPLKGEIFRQKDMIEFILKMDMIVLFLISDYYSLNQKKFIQKKEISECESKMIKILSEAILEEEVESQEKLKNLFLYLSGIITLIKNNNYNLSEIVYGLK